MNQVVQPNTVMEATPQPGCLVLESPPIAGTLPLFRLEPAVFASRFLPSPATRRFLLVLCAVVAIIVGYNVLMHIAAEKSQRRQLLSALNHIPSDTELLFLGNSLVE